MTEQEKTEQGPSCSEEAIRMGQKVPSRSGPVFRGADMPCESDKTGEKLCFVSSEMEDDHGNLLSTYSFVYTQL